MEDELKENLKETSHQPPSDEIMHELTKSMEVRLKMISDQQPDPDSAGCSIYRVPRFVRQINKEAYTPRIVSIGPYHHGHENLKAMEFHKTRYTRALFKRTPNPDLTSSDCIKAISSKVEKASRCYSGHEHDQTILGLGEGKLAEILLVDGCFILELLLRWENSEDYYSTDPIFGNASIINCLQRDLVLLENQIPFFVLQILFDLLFKRMMMQYEINDGLLEKLCVSFHLPLNFNSQRTLKNNNEHKHLLDIVRNYYLPYLKALRPKSHQTLESSIHCATKLKERGIKFRKGSTHHLFDIKFRDGVLEIPLLLLQDATESLLRNMIAFEQCCHGTSHHFTSYAMLMDHLIDTPRDVEILEQNRIITNNLGSGEDVSQLFNNMFKEVFLEDFFFGELCEEVNIYYNRRWPRYKRILARSLWNPWRTSLLLAIAMLLLLTMIQTVLAVLFYTRSLNPL